MGKEMKFYRYIRPLKFNEARVELETLTTGGVCLRFDQNEDGALRFSYARCHEDELFSKLVAKRIADNRASTIADVHTIPFMQNVENLCLAVIEYCSEEHESTHSPAVSKYLNLELKQLGGALELIVARNQREREKAEIWRSGIAAAHYGDRYESLSR